MNLLMQKFTSTLKLASQPSAIEPLKQSLFPYLYQSQIASLPNSLINSTLKRCIGGKPGWKPRIKQPREPYSDRAVLMNSENNFLHLMHKQGPKLKIKRTLKTKILSGAPQLKGVILKTAIRHPRKPNSGNRKCVIVRLSSGRETCAYVPGEGHNLQEHQIVLVEGGRLQDTPGVKTRCIRGKYDLPHVAKKIR